MDLIPWFPALTTTGLLAAALWLGRELISTRLTKSVQHKFDKKIESIKADLRASEERFKAQLREKEAEIAALRSGALTVLASRHAALDKRRLEAVDQLWSSFNALAPAPAIAANMAVINFESAAKEAERDPKVRQFFEMIGQGFDMKSLDLTGAANARPFLSPMVWAVYSAIRAVTFHSVVRLQILNGGLGSNDFADHKAIEKLVVAALPHYSEYLEKNVQPYTSTYWKRLTRSCSQNFRACCLARMETRQVFSKPQRLFAKPMPCSLRISSARVRPND